MQVHVEPLPDVRVEIFLAEAKLRLANLVARAAVVPVPVSDWRRARKVVFEGLGGGDGFGVFVAAGDDDLIGGGEVDRGEFDLGVERGGFGTVAFEAGAVLGQFAAAAFDEFGQFRAAGVHRLALAAGGFRGGPLLGGDLQADLVETLR